MNEDNLKTNRDNLETLRTYTSDMAEVIRNNEISVAKIAMDEKKKREEESYLDYEPTNNKKSFFIISGIILLIIAITTIYFVTKKSEEKNKVITTENKIDTIISYETSDKLDITNIKNKEEFVSLLDRNSNNKEGIRNFSLIKKYNDEERRVETEQLFNLIAYGAPMSLVRTLDNQYFLGEYLHGEKNSRFLVLKMNDYNQGYASMLTWEKSMLEDFGLLFRENYNKEDNEVGEAKIRWEDIVINNRDARILRGENNNILIYYLFINKDELIITNDIDTLKEVVNRILIKK